MLFLPPGSSRLTRVHGAYVSEKEINDVVDTGKNRLRPNTIRAILIAPHQARKTAKPMASEEFDGEGSRVSGCCSRGARDG